VKVRLEESILSLKPSIIIRVKHTHFPKYTHIFFVEVASEKKPKKRQTELTRLFGEPNSRINRKSISGQADSTQTAASRTRRIAPFGTKD
jgi:hypothetical protein